MGMLFLSYNMQIYTKKPRRWQRKKATGTFTKSLSLISSQAGWINKRPLDLEFDPASLNLWFLGDMALMRSKHISRGRKKPPNEVALS